MSSPIKYLTHNQIDKKKWDDCIAGSSNGLIYGYSFYLDAMARHWDGLVLNDYEAVMPLTWNKKYGITYLFQPFCCAMLGVFGRHINDATTEQFLLQIPNKFSYWDIYLNPGNITNSSVFNFYNRKNFILNLNQPYTQLHNRFNENIKRNIRKATQAGCTIIKPSLPDVLKLAKAQLQEFASVSQEDFQHVIALYNLLEQKNAAITYGVVSANGDLLSSCVFFIWQERAYYILAGNHPDGRLTGASHALINAFIKDHAGTNMVLDFEGSDLASLALFYKSFGSTEEIYPAIKLNRLPGIIKWLKN